MNRIVKDHYPVEKLPDDLRPALAAGSSVRVVVETLAPQDMLAARRKAIAELVAIKDLVPQAADDAAERISKLRDEWDR